MPAIGITGGISTGKSTFCECLREVLQGAKFFNADEAAKSDIGVRVGLPRFLGQITNLGHAPAATNDTFAEKVSVPLSVTPTAAKPSLNALNALKENTR